MPAKIKTNPETSIYFLNPTTSDSGVVPSGSPLVTFKPGGTANNSGHVSNQYDLGPGPRTTLFQWRAIASIPPGSGIPNMGTAVEQYFAGSDGVYVDGNLGTQDAAMTTDKRGNLAAAGGMVVDYQPPVSSGATYINSGLVQIFSRYISLVWWNALGVPLSSSGNVCILTPVPDEIEL